MNVATFFEPLLNEQEYETAEAMIALLDQVSACQDASRSLLLHVCSANLRGGVLDLSAVLETELSVLWSQAQQIARHI